MIITHICVKFIVGGLKVDLVKKFQEKHHSVNATACEYLELQLKSSKEKPISIYTAHSIVDPILKALMQSIGKRDNAMQVQLLNLLKVILFECKFSGNLENTKKVLTAQSFTDIMVSGLKN